MSDEIQARDIILLHDRRIGDQDQKIHDTQQAIKSIEHELRQLFERINMGVSPTLQKTLDRSAEIQTSVLEIKHKVELEMTNMNNKIDYGFEEMKVTQAEQGEKINKLQSILIYGVVIGVIAAGVKATWDHFGSKRETQESYISHIQNLQPKSTK